MSERKDEKWTCSKCNKEVPLIKTDEKFAGHKTIIQVNLEKYEVKKENLKKLYLCLACWRKEKNKFLPKIKEGEYSVYKNTFSKYININDSDSAWDGGYVSVHGVFCLFCQKFLLEDERINWEDSYFCSDGCLQKYKSLSLEEKENLTKQTSQLNQSQSNKNNMVEREREREREQIQPKSNTLLYFSLGLGGLALIGGLVYFFTRKNNRGKE